MSFLKSNSLFILGVIIGGIAGFLYWNFIGCNTGTCAITSKPLNSSIYGSVMGGLVFSLIKKTDKK